MKRPKAKGEDAATTEKRKTANAYGLKEQFCFVEAAFYSSLPLLTL